METFIFHFFLNYYKIDINKDFPDDEEVKTEYRLDELSKRRLNLLGYHIYKKCSLGEPVSYVELSKRLSIINKRYPNLTLENLINKCKLKDTPDKFTSENPYILKALDIVSDENLLAEDIIQNILPEYLQNEKHIEYYPNGKIKLEYSHIYGVKNGKFTSYYVNGNKYIESYYKNGKLDGRSIAYTDNGIKYRETYYKDDFPFVIQRYYITGEKNIKNESTYIEGPEGSALERDYKEWFPNGQIKKFIRYPNSRYGIPTVMAWKEDGTEIKYATLKEFTGRL